MQARPPSDEPLAGTTVALFYDHGGGPLWDEAGEVPNDPDWLRRELGLSDTFIADLIGTTASWISRCSAARLSGSSCRQNRWHQHDLGSFTRGPKARPSSGHLSGVAGTTRSVSIASDPLVREHAVSDRCQPVSPASRRDDARYR
jgi:hypothetical protein